jgi:prophage antirepressor-like protein
MKVKKIKENGTGLIKHPDFGEVRTEIIKGEAWFCATDVCSVLDIQNNRRVVDEMLDDDEKGVRNTYTLGGSQNMLFVSESGLYNLIFRSRKPEAKKFRRWVTSEVLPAIRRTGYYIHPSLEQEAKKMRGLMSDALKRYVTEEDLVKTAKKFGIDRHTVALIRDGIGKNSNAVMQELQRRAELNKEAEVNAYAPDRVRKLVEKLNS